MNRKNLTSAVLAGLAGVAGIASTAQAVNINPDGLGQVLLYPYYTVRGDNETLLSVVNTTGDAKAVKVRFNEGENSQEVLDFNLYMSPYDVWTAAVVLLSTADGPVPGLITADTSCTVPYLFADAPAGQPFLPFRLNDKGQAEGFEAIFPRGSEGHFEMIEMGVVTDDTESSAAAATHGVDGVPANCDQLVEAWFKPAPGDPIAPEYYWTADPTTDIEPPIGGLFGGANIVNVGRGTLYTYEAIAINGWNASGFDSTLASLHAEPGSIEPSLNSGDNLTATVFLDNGATLDSVGLTRSVDAVSFLFMHDKVMNEYVTGGIANGQTEWVMTFPTKKWYTFPGSSGSATPVAPFTELWESQSDVDPLDWGACENVLLAGIWDQEEQTPTEQPGDPIPPIVSPAPPNPDPDPFVPFELCYETSVIEFMGVEAMPLDGHLGSDILGSLNVTTFDNGALGFDAGWAWVDLYNYKADVTGDAATRTPLGGLAGLPVTGFSVNAFSNGTLEVDGENVLANYGGIFNHKATRLESSVAPQ